MLCEFRPGSLSHLVWRLTRPTPERMAEGAGVGVAEEVGDFGEAQALVAEVLLGEIGAQLVEDSKEARPTVLESAGQGADAHAQLARYRLGADLAARHQVHQHTLNLVAQPGRHRLAVGKDLLAIAGQDGE